MWGKSEFAWKLGKRETNEFKNICGVTKIDKVAYRLGLRYTQE